MAVKARPVPEEGQASEELVAHLVCLVLVLVLSASLLLAYMD